MPPLLLNFSFVDFQTYLRLDAVSECIYNASCVWLVGGLVALSVAKAT